MKNLFILLVLTACSFNLFAQSDSLSSTESAIKAPDKSGRLSIHLFSDIWQDVPDAIEGRSFNPGVGIGLMKVFKLGTNFSMAVGPELSIHNFHSNAMPIKDNSGVTSFQLLDSLYFNGIDYKKNKLSLTYIELPLEFRYATNKERKKQFRMAVGGKVGYLINSHLKYSGESLQDVFETTKFKNYQIANLSKLRYGITGLIGYGGINLRVFYSLSGLFEEGDGPEMYPISVALTIMPW